MVLGRYVVVRLAGAGGMGEVYQAWDTLLERHVALKAVLPEDGEDAAHLERFRWEARALAQLSHPNVCQVYDLVTLGRETFIAMEWLEGQTLEAAALGMDRRQKLRALQAVAEGLAYAHTKAMVHRDLKPANLMVEPGGQVKILDFGLARRGADGEEASVAVLDPMPGGVPGSSHAVVPGGEWLTAAHPSLPSPRFKPSPRSGGLTRQGKFMGSPRYASPEQVRGELADTQADVWSLGVVAWELLLGENPFPGQGVERLHGMLEGNRESARGRGLSRRLTRLLEAMLALEPAQRPTARAVARSLARELSPVRTTWWVASQAAILLLAVGGMYLLFGRGVAADLTRRHPARMAIYPALDRTGSAGGAVLARRLVPELLEASLRNVDQLAVVDAEELEKAAGRIHLPFAKGLSGPVMEKVAAAVGAKLFLAPSLELDGRGKATLKVEMRDGSGRVRYRTQAEAPADEASLPTACLQLAEAVARDLARAVDPLGPKRAAALPFLDQVALQRYALGEDLIHGGKFKDAEPLFRAVAFQYPGFSPAVAGYARCLTKTGNEPAEPVYLWARMAAKAQGYLKAELTMLQFQASHLMAKGERERARALCLEGLQMARAKGLPSHQGVLQNQLGTLAQVQNRPFEAAACYQAALAFLIQAGDPEGMARVTNNLAVLEKSQGRLEQAEAHYRSVLDTVVKAGNQWSEAVALNNLGELDLILGRLEQAEGFLNRALQLRTAIGDEAGLPYCNAAICLARHKRRI
jgi:tetratricopeptide (TPR) repeat protein